MDAVSGERQQVCNGDTQRTAAFWTDNIERIFEFH